MNDDPSQSAQLADALLVSLPPTTAMVVGIALRLQRDPLAWIRKVEPCHKAAPTLDDVLSNRHGKPGTFDETFEHQL